VPAHLCSRRLSPMMHRGYFTRVHAVRRAVDKFLANANPNLPIQIVNLGSGLDTLYLIWLLNSYLLPTVHALLCLVLFWKLRSDSRSERS